MGMRLSQQETPEGWSIWTNGDGRGPWYARRTRLFQLTPEAEEAGIALTVVEDSLEAVKEVITEQKALEAKLGAKP
ncbi:hypothetical protein GCM10010466_29480 [Planomonospora alba]|uniref:Uncharacterized protein n=1 Tax=Planomonospora alba TaxID=161354 RepID=A0ABP6N7D6_9ACTN